MSKDMFNMNFERNKFNINFNTQLKQWEVKENKKVLYSFDTYEEAEDMWSIYCSTLCIKVLSNS